MIATTRIWRWRKTKRGLSYVEVTEQGRRCDWVPPDHVYVTLGMVIPKEDHDNTR